MIDVTVSISTRGRYETTLPLALLSVCFQTYKPKELLIFDDGEHKDLRKENIYDHIFRMLSFKGIEWRVLFGEGKGQVLNHIKSIKESKHPFIWRLDDDNCAEPDALEKLVKNMVDGVGAVGGLVIDRIIDKPSIASNKIEDIYLGLNEQWFVHKKDAEPKEVDHLYSSFLYRKDIAEYCTDLSEIGHREESILTMEMKRKGYKIILDPSAVTWHFCSPSGGIRYGQREKLGMRDEGIFVNKLMEWGIKPNSYSHVVLDNGIGDHFVFKACIESYLEVNKGNKKIIFACYPEVFKDVPDVQLASIADAKTLFGDTEKFSIYKFMWDHNWKRRMEFAFRKVLGLSEENKKAGLPILFNGTGNTIIVSPYSKGLDHPKSYPYWKALIPELKSLGLRIIQIGKSGESLLKGVDELVLDLKFTEIEKLISECRFWIASDSFLQHLVNCMDKKMKGVVLFGPSDPEIFGYPYNLNLLKSRRFLRQRQFDVWDNEKKNNETFETPNKVMEMVKNHLIG